MSLEVRLGGITKVQSDFLKLSSSDPDLTLHLKQRGVGLDYPIKQQPERGEAFMGRPLWKNKWALKYQSKASGQVRYCHMQDKWNNVLEDTRRTIKKYSTGFRKKLLTSLLVVWHLCKILLEANIIKLSILSTGLRANIFSPPSHQIEMTFLSGLSPKCGKKCIFGNWSCFVSYVIFCPSCLGIFYVVRAFWGINPASDYREKIYLEFCSCGRENPAFYQVVQFNWSSRN